ncbi:hypothetical protein LR48_Vigan10g116400 [Vigna angularis]|uniref:Uncharacterized protein n=1 Tax=Phaseolus angularis TaxID=3914 RepID=A0A0L9VK33_PHAAN|nr:hypothetical protein LR48_Vigan10g116400 [Vigna angularis]
MSESHRNNTQATCRKMEAHCRFIIQKLDDLGSNMKANPREECTAVVTESGKVLDERKIERKEEESLSEKEKNVEEKKEKEESERKEKEREDKKEDERKIEREEKESLNEKEKDEERKEKQEVEREKKKKSAKELELRKAWKSTKKEKPHEAWAPNPRLEPRKIDVHRPGTLLGRQGGNPRSLSVQLKAQALHEDRPPPRHPKWGAQASCVVDPTQFLLCFNSFGPDPVSTLFRLYLKDLGALGLVSLPGVTQQHTLLLSEGGSGGGSFLFYS